MAKLAGRNFRRIRQNSPTPNRIESLKFARDLLSLAYVDMRI